MPRLEFDKALKFKTLKDVLVTMKNFPFVRPRPDGNYTVILPDLRRKLRPK